MSKRREYRNQAGQPQQHKPGTERQAHATDVHSQEFISSNLESKRTRGKRVDQTEDKRPAMLGDLEMP